MAASTSASSGCEAISPHSVTGLPCLAATSATSFSARSEAGESRSKRSATRGLPRSAANRNCTRSFEPTEAKSTLENSSSSWNSSAGTSSMTPTSTRSGRSWPWRRRWVNSRSTMWRARSNSSTAERVACAELREPESFEYALTKQYNVYSKVDTEADRYLEFERWWGGHVNLNAEEIQFIVDELFVGNNLAAGKIETSDGRKVDLRNIRSPRSPVFRAHGRQRHAATTGAALDPGLLCRRRRDQGLRADHRLHCSREHRASRHFRSSAGLPRKSTPNSPAIST